MTTVVAFFGFVLLAVFILHTCWLVWRGVQSSQKDRILAFYDECIQNQIYSLDSQKDIERAKLFAEKRKIPFTDISRIYQQGKEIRNQKTEDANISLADQRKREEQEKRDELEKYAGFTGRDKLIAMLTDQRNAELAAAGTIRNGSNALYNSTQQKEKSWAVHGGVASALAGTGAGIAAAMDIQNKNAAIRAQNAANLQSAQPALNLMYKAAGDRQKRAEAINREIEAAKTKLVSDDSPETCMSHIAFSDTKVEVSETGTCTVTTVAGMTSPMTIFGDVEAVVDGTVTARIYDGDSEIGKALLVLPCYGLKGNATLTGMSLFCGSKNKEYTVQFEPYKLWAIEGHYMASAQSSEAGGQGLNGATPQETASNIRTRILKVLRKNGGEMRVSEMMEADADLNEFSNQKISVCVQALVDRGAVEKTVRDRVSYFRAK